MSIAQIMRGGTLIASRGNRIKIFARVVYVTKMSRTIGPDLVLLVQTLPIMAETMHAETTPRALRLASPYSKLLCFFFHSLHYCPSIASRLDPLLNPRNTVKRIISVMGGDPDEAGRYRRLVEYVVVHLGKAAHWW